MLSSLLFLSGVATTTTIGKNLGPGSAILLMICSALINILCLFLYSYQQHDARPPAPILATGGFMMIGAGAASTGGATSTAY